jgi:hypothetical protein
VVAAFAATAFAAAIVATAAFAATAFAAAIVAAAAFAAAAFAAAIMAAATATTRYQQHLLKCKFSHFQSPVRSMGTSRNRVFSYPIETRSSAFFLLAARASYGERLLMSWRRRQDVGVFFF